MRPVTVVASIKPGQEAELREVLAAIGNDIEGNPHIRFPEDAWTHFARWFIIETPGHDPRLVFAATYNGDLSTYVANLVRISPGLDAIWGNCVGYAGKDTFYDFVPSHAARLRYSYTAYPTETVESIRDRIAIRQLLEPSLTPDDLAARLLRPDVQDRLERLSPYAPPNAFVRLLRRLLDSFADRGTKVFSEFREPKKYTRVLDIYSDPARRRAYLRHSEELAANVSPYKQNQLTVLAPITPGRTFRLKLALFLGGILARYGYPPGELTGTFTIHSLHWVILDKGRTGLVMSNYDGVWESYLGDFADKLHYGLDALFNNCVDYPPGGLSRIEAWGEWIRTAQLVVPVYYSAYPDETALRIGRDRAITNALLGARDRHDMAARVQGLL